MLRRIVVLFEVGLLVLACSHGAFGPSEGSGLGTAWGETRASSVDWVAFEREDPARPVEVVTLYYDDAEGVRAATRGPSFVGG